MLQEKVIVVNYAEFGEELRLGSGIVDEETTCPLGISAEGGRGFISVSQEVWEQTGIKDPPKRGAWVRLETETFGKSSEGAPLGERVTGMEVLDK